MRKVLHAVSATQMQLVDQLRPKIGKTKTQQSSEPGCESRYYFKYVEGLPDGPMGAGAQRGLEGHDRIETFLNTGQNILDALELEGLHKGHIPQPGPGLLVEQPMHLTYEVPNRNQIGWHTPILAQGVPVIGFIDLINTRFLASTGVLELVDWKFKKSIRDYAARGDDLLNPEHEMGIQMLPYAAWAVANRELFPGMTRVRLRHVTFQTKDAKVVHPAEAVADLQRIVYLWETVSRRIVPRIQAAFAAKSSVEVPKNTHNCFKYPPHGCPYKGPCMEHLDRMARLAMTLATPKESPMAGMLSSIMNPVAAVVPPPVQSAPPRIQDESTTKEIKAKDCVSGTKYRVGPHIATFLCNVGEQSTFLPEGGAPVVVSGESLVLPPMAAAPVVAPIAPVVAAPPPSAAAGPMTPPVQVAPMAPPVPVVPSITAAAPSLEEKPKRAPRAKKEDAQNGETIRIESPVVADGVWLYFGCAPVGVATKTLNDYTDAVQAYVLGDFKIPKEHQLDIRTSGSQELGFGKWKGFMREAVKLMAPLESGHYVITPGDERIETVANALAGSLPAGRVVMGGGR